MCCNAAGAEKYKSITSSYYRKCQGAILMFDVTDRKSFLNLRMWIAELRKIVDGKLTKIVLANKIDLTESGERSRQVSEEEMIDFCEDNGL